MQQLSGTDTGFLYAEQGNTYNHVAMLAIYDPSTAVDGNADGGPADGSPADRSPVRFKDILAHFKERLHVNPLFRRRLAEVPLGVDLSLHLWRLFHLGNPNRMYHQNHQ